MFQLLLFIVPGNTFAMLMGPQWIARGYLRTASVLSVAGGALGLLLSVLLVPRLGVRGAVWSSVTSYGVALLLNLGFFAYVQRRASLAVVLSEGGS